MGLEIIVITNVKQIAEGDIDRVKCLIPFQEAGVFEAKNMTGYKGSCSAFQGYCVGEEVMYYDAGSYISYNEYRQCLASLTGLTAEEMWDDSGEHMHEDFFEQINFTDWDGMFDYNVAERLFDAYERNLFRALLTFEEWAFNRYCNFMEAFKLTYEGKGVVVYL